MHRTPKALPAKPVKTAIYFAKLWSAHASSRRFFLLPLRLLKFLADLFFFVTDVAKMTLEKR